MERLAPLLWLVSGAVVGWSFAYMAFWPSPQRLAIAAAVGLAAILARGLARLTYLTMVALGFVTLCVAADVWMRHGSSLPVVWLLGLWAVVLAASIAVFRARVRWRSRPRTGFAPLLDLLAAVVVASWSLWFVHRVSAVGLESSLTFFLGGAEDNAAWVNAVSGMTSSGSVRTSSVAMDTFGPVVMVVLGIARLMVGRAQLGVPVAAAAGLAILTVSAWLVASAPLAALVVLIKIMRGSRFLRVLVGWFAVTAILAAQAVVLVTYGFLSAIVASLTLVVVVASIDTARPSMLGRWSWVRWAAVAVLMFEMGSSWFPLIPVGGLAIAVWILVALIAGLLRAPAPAWLLSGVAGLLGAVLLWALYQQGAAVLACCGGADPLVAADGGTPEVPAAVLAVGLALLGLGWAAAPTGLTGSSRRPILVPPLLVVVGYAVVVALFDAVRTTGGAHYGGKKLLYVVAGTWLAVVLVDLLVSQTRTHRPIEMTVAASLAVLASLTLQSGPLFVAAQSHWPAALPVPVWSAAVVKQIAPGDRVACLSTAAHQPANDLVSLEAYLCSRWAQSVAGTDTPEAVTWRFMLLGRVPVAAAVPFAHRPADQRLKLIVIGPTDKIDNPAAWWAPLLAGANVEVIPTS